MSKKNADREKEEEKDLDEEEDDEDEEEEEEEEESAPPAKATAARRTRTHRAHDEHEDDHEDEEEEATEEDDPFWWTPHAVMSALVLVGVLGFFGVFNKLAGGIPFLAKGNVHATEEKAAEKPAEKAGTVAAKPPEQRQEYGARHLLVQYKGAMRASPTITRTEEEAKARATEAMNKAKKGANFVDLVKEYSDEPNAAQRGGDLGKFHKGQMVPEFQNAVEKLKVGEVSDLVKTAFGYHVILRTQ